MCNTKKPEIKLPEIKQLVFDHRTLFNTFSECYYDLLYNTDDETAKSQIDLAKYMFEAYYYPNKMKTALRNGDTAIITPDIMEALDKQESDSHSDSHSIVIILKDNNIWAIISSEDINY
jgi:hypothetical protein